MRKQKPGRRAAAVRPPVLVWPTPFLLALFLLGRCSPVPAPMLTAADAADIGQVTAYLNSIPKFEASFVQTGSFGPDAGTIWADRPAGHLRIDYDDPEARVMVIADGGVRILDRTSGALTRLPVSRTPLGMLLTPRISLSGDITVQSVVHTGGSIEVVLRNTSHPGQGSLTLTLAEQPMRLIAVTLLDARQRSLTMTLSGLDTSPDLSDGLFQGPVLSSGG